MTTDISPFTAPAPAITAGGELASPSNQFERLGSWCETYMACAKVAQHLASTPFVPKEMMGKPETVAAAMLKGLELGIDPLDALSNVYIVHGRPGFYAEFMRRRVIELGHEFRVTETTDTRAKVAARRSGDDDWLQVTFTADQAKKAGINLGNYPADKLVARATSRMVRQNFPDVLSGAQMVEDLEDAAGSEPEAPPRRITAQAAPANTTGRRTARRSSGGRATLTAAPKTSDSPRTPAGREEEPEGMPPLPGDEPEAEAGSDTSEATETATASEVQGAGGEGASGGDMAGDGGPEMSTRSQQTKLNILLKEFGMDDRAAKLAYLEENFGRPFKSSAELTKAEASSFIDFLESESTNGQQ